MIDADNSGTITAGEFGKLLRLQGEDVTDDDAKLIIEQIDIDGDVTNLTFEEFESIMGDIKHLHDSAKPGDKFSLAQAFVEQTKHRSNAFQDKDPLYLKMQKAQANGMALSSTMNARMKVASFIDGNVSQVIVLTLVVVDVICVIMELMIVFTKCPCDPSASAYGYGYGYGGSSYGSSYGSSSYGSSSYSSSSYGSAYGSSYGDSSGSSYGDARRMQEADEPDSTPGQTWMEWLDQMAMTYDAKIGTKRQEQFSRFLVGAGTCSKKDPYVFSEEQLEWEIALNILSVSILAIFAMQISMLMFLYGKEFFANAFYVLDLVVVFGALLLETSHWHQWFIVQGGGLFALLLFWRIVRVIHGLFTSIEIQYAKLDAKITHDRNEMLELIVTSRRKGAAQKMFFSEYHVSLTDAGVKASLFAASDGGKAIQRGLLGTDTAVDGESKHETKKMLDLERIRRTKAEAMYMDAYSFFHEHIEGLQDHVIAIGTAHGEEGGHGH